MDILDPPIIIGIDAFDQTTLLERIQKTHQGRSLNPDLLGEIPLRHRPRSSQMQQRDPSRLRQSEMFHARIKAGSPATANPCKLHGEFLADAHLIAFLLIVC